MDLRPELLPLKFDKHLIARLGDIAAEIDGAMPGQWEDLLIEFNRLAGTAVPFEQFQGIYGGENHANWVRRLLRYKRTTAVADVTRDELIEIVRRADPRSGYPDWEAYMAVFDANVPYRNASNFLFYPPDYDEATNTWGGGRMMGEYDPSPEQIVDWALNPDDFQKGE